MAQRKTKAQQFSERRGQGRFVHADPERGARARTEEKEAAAAMRAWKKTLTTGEARFLKGGESDEQKEKREKREKKKRQKARARARKRAAATAV